MLGKHAWNSNRRQEPLTCSKGIRWDCLFGMWISTDCCCWQYYYYSIAISLFAGDMTDLDTVLNCFNSIALAASCCCNVFTHVSIMSTDEDCEDV